MWRSQTWLLPSLVQEYSLRYQGTALYVRLQFITIVVKGISSCIPEELQPMPKAFNVIYDQLLAVCIL